MVAVHSMMMSVAVGSILLRSVLDMGLARIDTGQKQWDMGQGLKRDRQNPQVAVVHKQADLYMYNEGERCTCMYELYMYIHVCII